MKKIRIDEKVTIWHIVEITFNDDEFDVNNKEQIAEALERGDFVDFETIDVFPETEEHICYDLDTIEIIKE